MVTIDFSATDETLPAVDIATMAEDAEELFDSLKATSKILMIDDEAINLQVMRRHLEKAGYANIIICSDPVKAGDTLRNANPDLVLLDVMMPVVSGIDILRAMSLDRRLCRVPVLVLTASKAGEIKRTALHLGATDFIEKPIDVEDLLARVRNALRTKSYQDQLRNQAQNLARLVHERTNDLLESRRDVVRCLARAAEYRDDDTGRHVMRVGRYVAIIADELGFSEPEIEDIELAAQLHDVGKIGIPDDILLKPGKLDLDQFELMRKHCGFGRNIIEPMREEEQRRLRRHTEIGGELLKVRSTSLLSLAARIAQTHHERFDGSGYPLGLAGDDIPIEGRMTAVADVFDALSSKRPYKPAFSREKCFQILDEGRGTHFDPRVLDAFFARKDDIVGVQISYMDDE